MIIGVNEKKDLISQHEKKHISIRDAHISDPLSVKSVKGLLYKEEFFDTVDQSLTKTKIAKYNLQDKPMPLKANRKQLLYS